MKVTEKTVLLYKTKKHSVELVLSGSLWHIRRRSKKALEVFSLTGKKGIFQAGGAETHFHPLMLLSLFIQSTRHREGNQELARFLEENYTKYLYQVKKIDDQFVAIKNR